jgi:hypothetical protein
MKSTGIVAGLLLVVAAAGCAGDDGSTPTASSVPPNDMPACEEIYAEGKVITNENFGLACVQGDDLISPRPVQLECADDRQLLFNDLAWGFFGETMTTTPADDPSKMPEDVVEECLTAIDGTTGGTDEDDADS